MDMAGMLDPLGAVPGLEFPDLPTIEVPPPVAIEPEVEPIDTEMVPDKESADLTIGRLLKRLDAYANSDERTEIEAKWLAVIRAYKGMVPEGPTPWKIEYVIREGFRQMETLKPLVARQFFSGPQLFKYKARNPGGEDKAAAATDIVHYQIDRHDIDVELRKWLDNATYLGTSYLTYGWQRFKNNRLKMTAMHTADEKARNSKKWWKRETVETLQEAPYARWLSPWMVYTHPRIEDPRKSPAVFVVEQASNADLKTLVRENWLDAKAVEEAIKENPSGWTPAQGTSPFADASGPLDSDINDDHPHELVTCWANSDEGLIEYVVMDRKFLLRARACEYDEIPLLTLRNYPQPEEHYGVPELVTVLEEQKMLNDFMSMWAESAHYVLSPMMKVKRGSAEKAWASTVFRPGGKLLVDNMDDVEPLVQVNTVMDILGVGRELRRNMQLANGLTDEVAGTGSSQKTATGLVRLQDAAGVRIEDKVRLFMKPFRAAYRQLYNLNARYLNEEVSLRLEGAGGVDIFAGGIPEDFEPDVDVNIELSNEMESGPEAAANWRQNYQLMGQDPRFNGEKIGEEVLKASGKKNTRQFLASSQSSQGDAMWENQQAFTGVLPGPSARDNHMLHLQLHALQMESPQFAILPPEIQRALQKHVEQHQAMLEEQQQSMQGASMAPTTDPMGAPGSVLPEADMRTEAMFSNAETGAAMGGQQ